MTGTIERHDGKELPFVDYEIVDGRKFPKSDINYTRIDALREKAIIL